MENIPKQLGDFKILRELGRGGMGVVYEAKQKSLNRIVALKVLSSGLGLTTKAIMRFKREAEAAAKLHHTNIVPIYSTGEENRIPYYAMELIDGPSLDQVIHQLRNGSAVESVGSLDSTDDASPVEQKSVPDWVKATIGLERPASDSGTAASTSSNADSSSSFGSDSNYFDNVASMMSEVADALAHAHDQGVIHRDIKPSNLLLSQDGRLSVNDFGLARMLEQPGMTISGELMGSPMYMSPEQIAVGRIPLDHRTDIYSLGAALYELITLEPPFEGRQRDQVLSQIIHKEPARPRTINKKIPKDLETICLKAMEKDPDRRYQTAELLARDLRHFVDRNAIFARRVGPMERAARWARKNKALTAMACITLMVIVSAATFFYVSNRNQLREKAEQQALTAAMCGNEAEALKNIQEAIKHGANETWSLMISSQVDGFRGEYDESLRKLQTVVDNDPDNLTAQFMLAEAFHANGQWEEYAQQLREFLPKQARTPVEKLFKAVALYVVSPKEALSNYDDAIEDLREFDLAWLWRAGARTAYALDQDNESEIVLALQEIEAVGLRLEGDNPMLSASRLNTRLAAYYIFRRRGEISRAESYLAAAASDVEVLANYPRFLYGNHGRMHYFDVKGDVTNIETVFREATKSGNKGYIVDTFATALYRAGRFQEALDELSRMLDQDDKHVAVSQVYFLMDTQAGRENAVKIASKMLIQGEISKREGIQCLRLLGRSDVATREASGLRSRSIESWKFADDVDGYLSDRVTEEDFIKSAQNSERDQGIAYFHIGLRKLAEGDREGALESFDKSASRLVFQWPQVKWSGAFAERIRTEPSWPDWLPSKTSAAHTQ